MTDKLNQALPYLTPGAFVPIDMETTALLLGALRQALAEKEGNEMTKDEALKPTVKLLITQE